MRRTVIVISLCFLLGVITSVIVAWWCVLWDGSDDPGYRLGHETGEFEINGWHGHVATGPGLMQVHAIEVDHPMPGILNMSPAGTREPAPPPTWVNFDHPPDRSSEIDALATGWPLHCVHYLRECHKPAVIREWAFDEHGVLLGVNPMMDHSERWLDVNRLPVAPLWTGLIANIGFYWAGWFAIALTGLPWHLFRRRRKRRRQRCLHCGHDQRQSTSSDVCTECGRDPRARRPMFGVMSISALSLTAVALSGVVIVFAVKYASEFPYSRIHYAAYRGDVETVRRELDRGVDIEAVNFHAPLIQFLSAQQGYTPLSAAASSDQPETVQLLIDAGADVNINGEMGPPLATALAHADLETARRLIAGGADVNLLSTGSAQFTVLINAAGNNRLDSFELLIKNGFDVARAEHSLSTAVARGHTEFMARMLEHGATVTHEVMRRAMRACDLELFDLLLEYGGDPLSTDAYYGSSLLGSARSEGDGLQIARRLIEAGVDVNATSQYGYTALMSCVRDVEIVRLLLDSGADIHPVNIEGGTAVVAAALGGSAESLLLLLERGADPEDLRGVEIWTDPEGRKREIIDRVLAELDNAKTGGATSESDDD